MADAMNLTEWGLPPLIISWFKKKGINSLFEWQVECLRKGDVLFGGNLVYSAPTSAGKTLVADFLLLKRVLEGGKKALVIEPFVALTREKAATLKSMLFTTKARVGAFGGNYYTPGGMTTVSVAVCTIEKANNFVNKMINEEKLSELGIIVVDEIHFIGDESRGYQLELLLTKVLYYNESQDRHKQIQIVGLSATIPNLAPLADWLRASLYVTEYRPVPLVEKIKLGEKIYEVPALLRDPTGCEPIDIINKSKTFIEKDIDDLFRLCIESIIDGHSTLVFCESKRECEIMAVNLAIQIKAAGRQTQSQNPEYVESANKLRNNISGPKISDTLKKLEKSPAGRDKELERSLSFGIAFHHAGLTSEEREIIEDGFKGGAIKVLMATSTLSSGVNLPARRVIIRSPTMFVSTSSGYQREMLNPSTYRQMIGRAGRKNIDTAGESILICTDENKSIAMKLIRSALSHITSSLAYRMIGAEGEPSGLKKAILEVIANGTATTRPKLNQYLKTTFWLSGSSPQEVEEFRKAVNETLRYLISNKFIEELTPGVYRSTRLGNAVLASGLHPDDSLELIKDLIKARSSFCLLNDLHIIYQVTPSDIYRTVEVKDWRHYRDIWFDLDEISQTVGVRVGIDELTLTKVANGKTSAMNSETERIYRRFWVALVINDLINEISLQKICSKYQMTKSTVQLAQRTVARFAGVISIFCNQLGYDNISALVTPLESRIDFSCQRDLLELIRLNITRPIARALFNGGYKNILAVAKADKLQVEFAIRQGKPFSRDASFSLKSEKVPNMWVPELAKTMTTLDYASHIVDTARTYFEVEYDIDLTPPSTGERRKSADSFSDDDGNLDHNRDHDIQHSPSKRSRLENGDNIERRDPTECEPQAELKMVRSRRRLYEPKVATIKVGSSTRDIDNFLDKWIRQSSISLSFKLTEIVDGQSIGVRVKRHRGATTSRSLDENANNISQPQVQGGLELRLNLENKKHIVTRLYASFDKETDVYIVDNIEGLIRIRDRLNDYLTNTYSSARAQTATQRREDFTPRKLYTKDIVQTYKILYAAFGLDHVILNRHFEWHGFDVAWWMINDCPHRGKNNVNSSLSLVAKTGWAKEYHHFLMPDSKKQGKILRRYSNDIETFKDELKAGKTAILKPLIDEILSRLDERNQLFAYSEAEVPSRLTMAHMIIDGFGLNAEQIKNEIDLYDELSEQLTIVAKKYYAKDANLSLTNNRDVARVLYDDLDLKRHLLEHSTISDIAKRPTNAEVLTILGEHHPFPKLVRDFRRIGKALDALQSANTHARFNEELQMMRVCGRCDFWQLTGRIAMSDPDLFLINRNFTVEIPAHGRREKEEINCAPRKCFVPYQKWIFVAADYSQLELRLLAHFANDPNLLQILNRCLDSDDTYDVFKTVAAAMYKLPIEEISDENRHHAKQICYGIIYGMGNTTLANRLNVDTSRAEEFRQEFFRTFPRILTFTDEVVADCERDGFVQSLFGRRRNIEGITSEISSVKSKARRVAINTKIQSSASDIIKLAMQRLNQRVLQNFNNNARLVLEMHDELIYELNPVFLDSFSRTLKFTMEEIASSEDLRVKLLVKLKKGTDWSNLETY